MRWLQRGLGVGENAVGAPAARTRAPEPRFMLRS